MYSNVLGNIINTELKWYDPVQCNITDSFLFNFTSTVPKEFVQFLFCPSHLTNDCIDYYSNIFANVPTEPQQMQFISF